MGDRAHADLLFPALASPPERPALRLGDRELDYAALRAAAARVAAEIAGNERVAVWAEPRLETAVAVVGALLAGGPAAPGNPKAGGRELPPLARDSAPGAGPPGPGSGPPRPPAPPP